MRLTIVLTVFNKEPYLRRALDSILGQKEVRGDEYEVLIVNDGSSDGSRAIINDYCLVSDRIRLLDQNNQGLSLARNNGTKASRGEYVWFVDADDIISPYAVRRICDATESNPDIVSIYSDTLGVPKLVRNGVSPYVKTGLEMLLDKNWGVCGVFNVLKGSFLKEFNLSFFPGIYHEDNDFTPRMLYFARSVVVIPEVLYTVIHVPGSITQAPRAKRAFDSLIVAENLFNFVQENDGMTPDIKRVFCERIAISINNAFDVIARNNKEEQARFNEAFKKKLFLLKPLKLTGIIKYRFEALIFHIFSCHTVGAYKVMKAMLVKKT